MRLKHLRLVAALAFTVLAALTSTSTTISAASSTIWGASIVPLGPDSDRSAVELGVRFRSDTSGVITGIRFYKFAGKTGTGRDHRQHDDDHRKHHLRRVFHGTADVYALSGATPNRAGTLRDAAGANGGYSAAFTYDLARSIVYMRRGNPAWAGPERDGFTPIRANDVFFGASSTDGRADWVDLDKVAIPQAAEQQRLLVNLNRIRRPPPRFWYLPNGHKAAVVMTGEDHVLSWNGTTLSFSLDAAAGATGLQVMLPTSIVTATHALSSVILNGSPVASARRTAKGVEYAVFQVAAGAYQVTYVP